MRKTVQFVLMFTVIASTLSLSASVLDRVPATPDVATVTTTSDFGAIDFARSSRPEERSFIPEFSRPTQGPDLGSGSTGGTVGPMFINLDRPQFDSRFTFPGAPVGTPEPGSLALLASGLLSGVYFVRRRK